MIVVTGATGTVGCALTHGELAGQPAAAAGHPVTYTALTPEVALDGLLGMGWDRWRAEGMVELYGLYAAGRASAVSPDVEKLTGRPPRSFAGFAAEHADAFRA